MRARIAVLLTVSALFSVSTLLVATPASAASLVEITNFGTNPTGLRMFLYVPNNVAPHPAVLLAVHFCTGSGPVFFQNTEFASLADRFGFIVIYPSATRSGACFDVSTPGALTHNGNSDPVGLVSMVRWVLQNRNGDTNRVFVTGASSGGMMTNVLLGDYPDVFKAGAAFMGVPFGCFATTDGSLWNSQCANGQITRTPQQWGDLARGAFPGFTGARPRMQVWHGTADGTLNFHNFGEEIKQWTNVLGVSQTPVFTDTPQSGWTRTRYGNSSTQAAVEAISVQGVGHVLPLAGQAAMAITFLGLDGGAPPTPTPVPNGSILTNGNIESGTTGWAPFGSGSLGTSSVVHGGANSLLMTGRSAAWNGPSQDLTSRVVNGHSYTTNVWVRTQTGTPSAKVTMALTVNGSTSFVTLAPATTVSSSAWTLLSGTATVSWSGTLATARFYVETTAGTDNLLVDDASFQ